MSEPPPPRNVVTCPRCGEVKLETPPGTVVLPTFGRALKAARAGSGDAMCECGKRRLDDVVRADGSQAPDPAPSPGAGPRLPERS